jgi:RNA polymerase sigma factor (sigma-70 family)
MHTTTMPLGPDAGRNRLAEIFSRERARLLQVVRRRLFDVSIADAEDFVQDVFHNILRRADLIEQIENLTGYVYQSLANRIADRRRSPPREILLSPDDGSDYDPLRQALEPVSPDLDPEELLRRKQLRGEIRRALDALPPPDRAIWIETEIEGRSFREIASETGEPVGTLLSRKSRAAKLLRAHLRRKGHA